MLRFLFTLSLLVILYTSLISQENRIAGMTIVAPPAPFENNPMTDLDETSTQWVALVPYAFLARNNAEIRFGSKRQWWGEREEGIIESIRLAKENNLKIMLKPQVWMHGLWIGDMDFSEEEDWLLWEKSYRSYIMSFVDIAIKFDVEMICIGTEFKVASVKREAYWRKLIQEVRSKYDGMITYSSNWDSYNKIPFWDALDFVGVSAYFPLTEAATPNVSFLVYKWESVKKKLERFSKKTNKPILFTEYGYLSVDGCAGKTWVLEKQRKELAANQKAQANALEALYSSFWPENWWAGGFMWKWYPNGVAQEGRRQKDYTPQGKISIATINKWYQKASSL